MKTKEQLQKDILDLLNANLLNKTIECSWFITNQFEKVLKEYIVQELTDCGYNNFNIYFVKNSREQTISVEAYKCKNDTTIRSNLLHIDYKKQSHRLNWIYANFSCVVYDDFKTRISDKIKAIEDDQNTKRARLEKAIENAKKIMSALNVDYATFELIMYNISEYKYNSNFENALKDFGGNQ